MTDKAELAAEKSELPRDTGGGGAMNIDWVEIPAGAFVYQGEAAKNERFQMARYPVTNAQFQAYLDDGGTAGASSCWDEPDHPRTNVSWHEANAYCAWLGKKLGREVRLPTEREWERAASGTDGRKYPWGNEYKVGYANLDETADGAGPHYRGRTSAVGAYPQGASLEGVLDLSGNVWEWCSDKYREDRMWRVLRGGSWIDDLDFARSSYRYGLPPEARHLFVGFRVVACGPARRLGAVAEEQTRIFD